MRRELFALVLALLAAPALGQTSKPLTASSLPLAGIEPVPYDTSCLVSGRIGVFLGSPVVLGCDAGLTYNATTDTLTTTTFVGALTGTASGNPTNAAGANVVPKSNGTNLVASSLTDDGTTVSTTEPVVAATFGADTAATDTVPPARSLTAQSANPLAATNTTGAALYLAGGLGTKKLTVVTYGSTGGKTVTFTWVSTTTTGATVLTEGAGSPVWDCVTTSNNACAVSLAAAINGNATLTTLMTATALSAVVGITKKAGLVTLTLSTNAGAALVASNGTDGAVSFPSATLSGMFKIGTASFYDVGYALVSTTGLQGTTFYGQAYNLASSTGAFSFFGGAAYDLILTRRAAATLNLGAADANAPVNQALTAQGSTLAGTPGAQLMIYPGPAPAANVTTATAGAPLVLRATNATADSDTAATAATGGVVKILGGMGAGDAGAGGNVTIAGGIGGRKYTIVDYNAIDAAESLTFTLDGTACVGTFVTTASTTGCPAFDMQCVGMNGGGGSTNAACATTVAAAIAGNSTALSGITAVANGADVVLSKLSTSSVATLALATSCSAGECTATSGADGNVAGTFTGPSATFTNLSGTNSTFTNLSGTNSISVGAGGMSRYGGGGPLIIGTWSNSSTTYDIVAIGTGTHTNTANATNVLKIVPTYNQAASTASNTDLLINRTETAIGSGAQLLIDTQVGSVSKFAVSNNGATSARNYSALLTADATVQMGQVVMPDAGTDGRFDVNTGSATTAIGVLSGTGASAAGTSYAVVVGGLAYVAPAEDQTVTRGHFLCQSATAGYVDDSATLCTAGLGIAKSMYSEPVTATIQFNGCTGGSGCINTALNTPNAGPAGQISLSVDVAALGWAVGQPVIFWNSGGTTPTGLTDGAVYWLLSVSTTDVTIAATKGGTIIVPSSQGDDSTQYISRLPQAIVNIQ